MTRSHRIAGDQIVASLTPEGLMSEASQHASELSQMPSKEQSDAPWMAVPLQLLKQHYPLDPATLQMIVWPNAVPRVYENLLKSNHSNGDS